MRKFAILIVVIACIMLLPAMFFQRHAMACELLPVLNYQQIIDGVFVEMEDTDTSADRAKAITGLIAAASERMTDLYGAPASKPRVVITSDVQKAASWGSNETASMHRMPWRACIIIGPKGQNVDVIAHEWLHAEIQHRVGFFRFLQEIPVWFDEGAALTLDYRAPFLPENIELSEADIAAVKNRKSGRHFFSGTVRQNYQAARLAVQPLIRPEQFFDDLERIAAGQSFEAVFLQMDKSMQPTASGLAN